MANYLLYALTFKNIYEIDQKTVAYSWSAFHVSCFWSVRRDSTEGFLCSGVPGPMFLSFLKKYYFLIYTSVYKTCRNVTETSQMADGVVGWLVGWLFWV